MRVTVLTDGRPLKDRARDALRGAVGGPRDITAPMARLVTAAMGRSVGAVTTATIPLHVAPRAPPGGSLVGPSVRSAPPNERGAKPRNSAPPRRLTCRTKY
jgi:hypothetical protein